MTQEQKAKAYDEALERAEGVIEQNPLMEYLKKGIEYIFPELKESEDEQVRKDIIEFLQDCNAIDSGYFKKYCKTKIEKMIAWLEKQGEQKPADSHCSDCTNAKGCVNCTDGDMKETGKSAWSIEDGKSLNRIVGALKCMVMDYNVDDEETLEKDISWLKSLKERL